VKRGEVWTAAGGRDYAGKPRPVVVVQDDRFDATGSITVRLHEYFGLRQSSLAVEPHGVTAASQMIAAEREEIG
jgi:mRNA-degrading endonuclease toxin of MazEF toxin-antitoxin module